MILIDGDPLTYRIGFAIERDPMGMVAGRYNMTKAIDRILIDLAPHYKGDYRIFIGGEGNFRKKRANLIPYKGNRAISNRPKHYDALRELLVREWGAEIINGMEADDKLGIELTKGYKESKHEGDTAFSEHICVSIDKDLLMVPGDHYNFVKKTFNYIDEKTGYKNFTRQMLTGDATDNIPGLRGIGPKAADKLVNSVVSETKKEYDNMVFETYKSKVHGGMLKLKNKVTVNVARDDDIRFVLAELRDLLWIRRYEEENNV